MNTAIDVSVIIVNYRTVGLLIDTIDSVFAKVNDVIFEIIVVDNHSEDDSERIIRERYGDNVRFWPLSENIGFGRANNEGVRIAGGRNLLFLNPDTVLVNNAIGILSDYIDTHPNVGAAGGNLYTMDMQPNASFGRTLPCLFDEIDRAFFRFCSRLIFGKNILFNYSEKPLEVGFVCGANLMVSKRILEETGAFDPDFFMYYEETELSWRIKAKGYKIMNVPQAKIIHLEGQSFSQSYERELRMFTSRRIYYRKTHTFPYQVIVDMNYTLLTMFAWMFSIVFGLKSFRMKMRQRLEILRTVHKNRKSN